jgi:hypothetical protein
VLLVEQLAVMMVEQLAVMMVDLTVGWKVGWKA